MIYFQGFFSKINTVEGRDYSSTKCWKQNSITNAKAEKNYLKKKLLRIFLKYRTEPKP
jgi:hypothetical protein